MAFAHAHKPHPILHRDLKPSNILLDQHYRAAVADMGLASGAGTLSKTTTGGGTMAYDAPEVLDEDKWSTAGEQEVGKTAQIGIAVMKTHFSCFHDRGCLQLCCSGVGDGDGRCAVAGEQH